MSSFTVAPYILQYCFWVHTRAINKLISKDVCFKARNIGCILCPVSSVCFITYLILKMGVCEKKQGSFYR